MTINHNKERQQIDESELSMRRELTLAIKIISADDTYPIRQRVLWPDKPISSIKIPEDKGALHIGAVIDGKLVGCVSLFRDGETFQFRKLAVFIAYRRHGIGRALIGKCIIEAKKSQVKVLWCDARCNVLDFYRSLGFIIDEERFVKNGMDYQKAYFNILNSQSKL